MLRFCAFLALLTFAHSTMTTCAGQKDIYKASGCCGNPKKTMTNSEFQTCGECKAWYKKYCCGKNAHFVPLPTAELPMEQAWLQWLKQFEKNYDSNKSYNEARAQWEKSHAYIVQHNSEANKTFVMAHGPHSDREEPPTGHLPSAPYEDISPIQANSTDGRRLEDVMPPGARNLGVLPESRDWEYLGYTPPVGNQGHCGSCWTFSSTAAISAAYAIEHGKTPPLLSQQQLLTCSIGTSRALSQLKPDCIGGNIANAFLYAGAAYSKTLTVGCWNRRLWTKTFKAAGLESQARALKTSPIEMFDSYKYTAGCIGGCTPTDTGCSRGCTGPDPLNLGSCGKSQSGNMMSISSFVFVRTESDLPAAVAQQPVSITIYAGPDVMHYKSGVLSKCGDGGTNTNHAVVAVGYGTDPYSGLAYWKIRNSWGTWSGEKGHFRMARGYNMCAIGSASRGSWMAYPTGTKLTTNPVIPTPILVPSPPPQAGLWSNPDAGACPSGSKDLTSILQGVPAGTPCAPECTDQACPSYPSPGSAHVYPFCWWSSPVGNFCALICGTNGWNCPSGMQCTKSSGLGTCVYAW